MIIIIHGDNSLRSHIAMKGYVDRLASNDFIVEHKDSSVATGGEVDEFLNASSLFGGMDRKALVLKDFFASKNDKTYKQVLNGAKSLNDKYVILYDSENIKKTPDFRHIDADDVIECARPTRQEMITWLDKFVDHSNRLNIGVISNVVDKCENDVWLSYNELKKLDTYCLEKDVEMKDVDKLMIGNNTDDNIFKMIDLLFDGKIEEAFDRFYVCKKYGVSGILILTMIERQIRMIELIREQLKKGEKDINVISSNVSLPVFAVRKYIKYLPKHHTGIVKSLYSRLESYDEKIKNGLIDPYFSCELVFFSVASI